MSTTNIINRYFEQEVMKAGYISDDYDISWSLSYSQGDGMDFQGDITRIGVAKLIDRLVVDAEPRTRLHKLLADRNLDVSIQKTSHQYSHYNTMAVSVESTSGLDVTYFENRVKEDVKELSKRLEKEGYQILEAFNPMWYKMPSLWKSRDDGSVARTFKREFLSVELAMMPNTDYSDDYDEVHDLLTGNVVVYDLKVTVLDDGLPVYTETVYDIWDKANQIQPYNVAHSVLASARSVIQAKGERLRRLWWDPKITLV